MRQLVRDLALALRETVLPLHGAHAGRAHVKGFQGGDVTFEIDRRAEQTLSRFLEARAPEVAVFSEHSGLTAPAGAAKVLVVDPVDGTRPALAGLESCCVSVACAPLHDGVTMGEVQVGCVVEIPSGAVFLAERGRGLIESPGVSLSPNEELGRMFWTYGFRGRPALALAEVLADLIDLSSVGGGCFELGSACFDMTRIVTGQCDAYVEPSPRLVDELPGMRAEFERVGSGAVLNNSPYDLAAAALCVEEAGGVVTDARGKSLHDRPLLGSNADFQMSVCAASNPVLHGLILEKLDAGIERLAARRK